METHFILAALLSICSLGFSQECNRRYQENIDFPGTDIKFVFAADVDHCQQLCTQHAGCLFFTFIRPDWTTDDRHFYCYLKTTPSGRPNTQTPLQGVTSGYSLKSCTPETQPCLPSVYQDVDFFGADYTSLFTADHEECQRVCTSDPACQFFTFVNDKYKTEKIRFKCHLKFSWPVPITPIVKRRVGVVSGFSQVLPIRQGNKPACQGKLFPNTDIPGNDKLALPAASPGHCQTLCSTHPECTYFSFDSNNFTCFLKDNKNEIVTRAAIGVTSGLPARNCLVEEDWIKVAYEGIDFEFSDIRFELMDDADSCEKTCTRDVTCQFYAYSTNNFFDTTYRRRCYLKRTVIMPAPPKIVKLDNVVSGFTLRNCI